MAQRAPRRGTTCGRPPADRGAVTVEAALALGTLTVFLMLGLAAIAAVVQTVRCVDAARELARLTARGEAALARSVAAQLAPGDAGFEITGAEGRTIVARVTARPWGPLPVTVGGRAVAALEPGVEAP